MSRVAILSSAATERCSSARCDLGPRCKYHPTCSQYALDALREFGFAAERARRLAAPPLQPVEPRRRRLRARPAVFPLQEDARDLRLAILGPIEDVLTAVLEWFHSTVGLRGPGRSSSSR